MTFSIEQLRGFVAVAEELHFGRAAERVSITQPPLSRQIQKLEQYVGVRLVERDTRLVRLTPAGAAFLVEARRILALADLAPETARRVAAGLAGRVTIGFTATAALEVLGPILGDCASFFPDVDVVLSEHTSDQQAALLMDGRVDLALLRYPPKLNGTGSRVVHREPLVAAVPAGHPLADFSGGIPIEAFAETNLIGYSPEHARYFADLLGAMFAGTAITPAREMKQILAMCALVAAGHGVAVVPRSMKRVRMHGLVFRKIRGWERPVVELHVAWVDDSPNPAVHRLLSSLPALAERQ